MLKIPRSSKSVLKYSDNSWPEHTAFKYLSHKSCFFHFFQSKHTSAPPPTLNKLDEIAGTISKYMEVTSVFYYGKVEPPNLT